MIRNVLRSPLFGPLESKWGGATAVYVDSADGDDGNAGTLAAPLQTLSALTIEDGMTIKLKRGSVFRETLSATGVANVTVEAYGSGLMPVMDCADVVSGTWTRPDAAGNPNVWSLAISNASDVQGNFASIWEDGARLEFVADRSTCNSTPGSFCITGSATGVYGASSTTFEIHASDSGNPNSNGKEYETAKRAFGIATGENWIIRNLRAKRNGHNNGSVALGDGSKAYGCIAEDGVKHNWYVGLNCELYDCIVYDCDLPHPDRDGWTGFVSHSDDASGATSHYERCKVILPKAVNDWRIANSGAGLQAFYAHTDGADGHDWDEITYIDCVVEYCQSGIATADTTNTVITRTRAAGCQFPISIGTGTITDPWLYQAGGIPLARGIQTGAGTVTIDGLRLWAQTDGNDGHVYCLHSTGLTTVTRSALCRTDPGGSGYQTFIRSDGTGMSMTGTVIFGANTVSGEAAVDIGEGSAREFDNNAYGSAGVDFEVGATQFANVAAWLANELGFDANSVAVASNPFTDAANGDFTLTAGSGLDTDVYGLERFPTYETIPDSAAIAAM